MKCPNCNAELAENLWFCTECGYKLQPLRCPNCGNMAEQGEKFCTVCGTSLLSPVIVKGKWYNQGGRDTKRKVILFAAAIVALVVAAAGGVLLYRMRSDVSREKTVQSGEEQQTAREEDETAKEALTEYSLSISESLIFTEAGEMQTIAVATNIEVPSEIEWASGNELVATVDSNGQVTAAGSGETLVYARWGDLEASCRVICEIVESQLVIDTSTVSNYSANLDPDAYLYYDSEDFTFYYPSNLYNSGTESLDSYTTTAGVNVRDVLLEGDDGITEAHLNKSQWTGASSATGELQNLYANYSSQLYSMTQISYSEENSNFIVTGYYDSAQTAAAYILVRVNESYAYTMEIVFPYNGDSSSEDYLEKCYVVENIYRMCGFSGSTYKARTYTQYLNGEQGDSY
ncbi:MAG: zinc ribbon domain-containing protein [Lachnospiraceae bacterium]|nr:zinc ribbon domain-containing protein [Lachnospiraceae bacterium]